MRKSIKWMLLLIVVILMGCKVDQAICPAEVEVPGVFSPNNDGENDIFRATITGAKTWKATIYDLEGEVMDSTVNQEVTWDGTSPYKEVTPGIYILRIEGKDYCDNTFTKARKVILTK